MSLKDKPLQTVTCEDLQSLIESEVSEGRDLEFKEELPATSDAAKREFLADVTSFANSAGGFIIYGIREAGGVASNLVGVDAEEAVVLRLDNLARDAVEPRMIGLGMQIVDCQGTRFLVVRIPTSWIGPHMVTFKGGSRFYARNSAGKYQLDVSELRDAFSRTAEIPEQLEAFRRSRLGKIVAGETPVPLSDGPRVVLHLVPFSSLRERTAIDLEGIDQGSDGFRALASERRDHRYNFDGIAVSRWPDEGTVDGYLQIFRDGRLEATSAYLVRPDDEAPDQIGSVLFETTLIEYVGRYVRLIESYGGTLPIAVLLSLTGVRGLRIRPDTWNRHWDSFRYPIDRDVLLPPPILVDAFDDQPAAFLRSVFDQIWNAGGWVRSMNYDGDGRRREGR